MADPTTRSRALLGLGDIAPDGVETRLFVGGEWRDGATFGVVDPGTGETVAEVADATVEDAVAAVDAAQHAFRKWADTAPRLRSDILRRTFELMIARQEQIAGIITIESGKTLAEARNEVRYAAEFLRWFSEEAVRIDGDYHVASGGGNRVVVMRQPLGVALFITPWNFPAAMATRKIGAAFAAGCTVVLKPAKETPLTALLIGRLFEEAGLPDGVLNIVPTTRARALTAAMLADPRIRKLSFTGSTETGRVLLAQAAQGIVNCSMELGGNAPFIVFDDADLKTAAAAAIVAKTRNGGQSCTAANRFYVHRSRYDAFCETFAARLDALSVGHGLAGDVDVGAMISSKARGDIACLVGDAVAEGAVALTKRALPESGGYFMPPTLLAQVGADASIVGKEIFGPVAPVVVFDEEDEVVARANDTQMGLVAFVCSGNLARAMRVSERLECGMVGINRGVVSDPAAPFGGWKQSGLGREGGKEGIHEYLETKYIAAGW